MHGMHDKNRSISARIDLNLLVLFEAIYRLRNLTIAGQEVGLSQPAVSRALGRLREFYGDTLFVRQQRGVQPTAAADRLAEPVMRALSLVREAVEKPEFDIHTSSRRFKLALSDIAERFFLPRLATKLLQIAPLISVESRAFETGELNELLRSGEIDMAVGYLPDLGKQIRTERLLRESYVHVARRGHSRLAGRISVEQVKTLPYVLVDPPGTLHAQAVRGMHKRMRSKAHPVLQVQSFFCVGPIVEQSDLIAVVPENLAKLVSQNLDLQLIAPPRQIGSFDITMAWHQRYHRDPGVEWLRRTFASLFPAGRV
jgi:DNA-binding transcriptional LysR family regulator